MAEQTHHDNSKIWPTSAIPRQSPSFESMTLPSQMQSKAEIAYRALLEKWWLQMPGEPDDRYGSHHESAKAFSNAVERIDSAAVSVGFMAEAELLLASNLLARGEMQAGWEWMDKSQAHALFLYEVMSEMVWKPTRYQRMHFRFDCFCTHFALVLARGSERDILWYAQHLYNLKRSGLADESCDAPDYVDFYFEMASAVLRAEWPSRDSIPPAFGPYQELFFAADDEKLIEQAVYGCAEHHLTISGRVGSDEEAESHPFLSLQHGHVAYELVGWLALYRRLTGLAAPSVSHPMLAPTLLIAPAQQPFSDELLSKLRLNARSTFGTAWEKAPVLDYDNLQRP